MLASEQILLKERIRHLLHIKKCTISSLSENETDRVRISRQINGDANITIDTIRLILFAFPNVSADWLILGDSKTEKSNHFSTPILSNAADSTSILSIDDSIAQNSNLDISSRIKYVLSEKQVSVAELAGSETQRIKFSRQLNGHNGLTLPVVVKVLDRFPDVSAEWLIRGEGQMDKSNNILYMYETELNNTRERIKLLIKNSGKSATMIAGGSGNPMQTKMSRQINFDTMLTFDVIFHILQSFPDISADWLILGDSKTDRSNKSAPPVPSNKAYSSFIPSIDDAIAQRDALINTLRAQIDQLTKDKELLHGLLESMTVPAKSNSKTTKNR